jgi:purine-binding chemotaxis protein CheW
MARGSKKTSDEPAVVTADGDGATGAAEGDGGGAGAVDASQGTMAAMATEERAGGGKRQHFGSGTNAHIVIFRSGTGYFGIDIGIVQEIVLMQEITPIPGSASYVAGMTDLRGRVIPVAAFTELLGMEPSARTDETRILVVENGSGHIGFIVDAVSEVMMVDGQHIEDASALGSREHDFIAAIAKLPEHLVSLVDTARLLEAADRAGIRFG